MFWNLTLSMAFFLLSFRSFIKSNGHALRSQPYHLRKSTGYRDLIPTSRKHERRFCIVAINRWMAYYCCLPLVAHAVGETRIPTYAMAPYRSAKRAEESRNKRIEKTPRRAQQVLLIDRSWRRTWSKGLTDSNCDEGKFPPANSYRLRWRPAKIVAFFRLHAFWSQDCSSACA